MRDILLTIWHFLLGIIRSTKTLPFTTFSGHLFEDKEIHKGCEVTISECACGKKDISWKKL